MSGNGTSPAEFHALVLQSQERYSQAAELLRRSLANEPENPRLHAHLAVSLSQTGQLSEAAEAARVAVGLAPSDATCHRALALVCIEQRSWQSAIVSVREAIELEPAEPQNYVLLARAHTGRRRWNDVLLATEHGLQIDPENRGCQNLQALAQLGLGRLELTSEIVKESLAQRPEDAWVHACEGWMHLIHRRSRQAIESFREALRLYPNLDWARQGLVRSLKCRNWLYRIVIFARDETVPPAGIGTLGHLVQQLFRGFFLAMWIISFIVVGFTSMMMMIEAPPTAAWIYGLAGLVLYGLLLALLANPLADICLLLDPRTKFMLSPREILGSQASLMVLALPAPFLSLAIATGANPRDMVSGMMLAILAIPTYLAGRVESAGRQIAAWTVVSALLALGLFAALPLDRLGGAEFQQEWTASRISAFVFFLHGSWIGSIVLHRLRTAAR